MTTQAIPSGRTVRTVKPVPQGRNQIERALWLFMRYSGLILVFLALSHFWVQHLLIGTQAITTAQTVVFWGEQGKAITIGQVLFRLYYGVLLVLAMMHGLNGLRQVAYDYLQKPAVYRLFMGAMAVLIGALTVLGAAALVVGARSLH